MSGKPRVIQRLFSFLGVILSTGWTTTWILGLILVTVRCRDAAVVRPVGDDSGVEVYALAQEVFAPLPVYDTVHFSSRDWKEIELGKRLFYDPMLSVNREISCATCHPIECYGVDGMATSVGHSGWRGTRNAPTVFNAVLQYAQFWDARVRTLEEQWTGPLFNHREMGMVDTSLLMERIMSDTVYAQKITALYGARPELKHLGQLISAFERLLITPGRWDRFLEGDKGALSHEEKEGLARFIEWKCIDCHRGVLLGGDMATSIPGGEKYWLLTGSRSYDGGRYRVTGNPSDKMVFKVPGLRNVAETGPYFHDGSVGTLYEAVEIMARASSRRATRSELSQVVRFLQSLTGDIEQYERLNSKFN